MRTSPIANREQLAEAIAQAKADPTGKSKWYVMRVAKAMRLENDLPSEWSADAEKAAGVRRVPESKEPTVAESLAHETADAIETASTGDDVLALAASASVQAMRDGAYDEFMDNFSSAIDRLVVHDRLYGDDADAIIAAARKVASAAGAKRYGKPIGAPLGDGVAGTVAERAASVATLRNLTTSTKAGTKIAVKNDDGTASSRTLLHTDDDGDAVVMHATDSAGVIHKTRVPKNARVDIEAAETNSSAWKSAAEQLDARREALRKRMEAKKSAMTASVYADAETNVNEALTAGVRKVASAEGVRRYKLPIGTPLDGSHGDDAVKSVARIGDSSDKSTSSETKKPSLKPGESVYLSGPKRGQVDTESSSSAQSRPEIAGVPAAERRKATSVPIAGGDRPVEKSAANDSSKKTDAPKFKKEDVIADYIAAVKKNRELRNKGDNIRASQNTRKEIDSLRKYMSENNIDVPAVPKDDVPVAGADKRPDIAGVAPGEMRKATSVPIAGGDRSGSSRNLTADELRDKYKKSLTSKPISDIVNSYAQARSRNKFGSDDDQIKLLQAEINTRIGKVPTENETASSDSTREAKYASRLKGRTVSELLNEVAGLHSSNKNGDNDSQIKLIGNELSRREKASSSSSDANKKTESSAKTDADSKTDASDPGRGAAHAEDEYRPAPIKNEGNVELFHGGLPVGTTIEDIDVNRAGDQQNKRRRSFGGFYLTDSTSKSWSDQYARSRGGTNHAFKISPDARIGEISDMNGSSNIDRISESQRAHMAKSFDVIKGKDLLGRTQYLLLNKDVVSEVIETDVDKPDAAPIKTTPKSAAKAATPSSTPAASSAIDDELSEIDKDLASLKSRLEKASPSAIMIIGQSIGQLGDRRRKLLAQKAAASPTDKPDASKAPEAKTPAKAPVAATNAPKTDTPKTESSSSDSTKSGAFVTDKQQSYGNVNLDAKGKDPERFEPKTSYADGNKPVVGDRVTDAKGRQGTVAQTYQIYTAVKWDDTGKNQTVKNDKLNSASASSSSASTKTKAPATKVTSAEPVKTAESPAQQTDYASDYAGLDNRQLDDRIGDLRSKWATTRDKVKRQEIKDRIQAATDAKKSATKSAAKSRDLAKQAIDDEIGALRTKRRAARTASERSAIDQQIGALETKRRSGKA